MKLISFFVERPISALMIYSLFILAGIFGFLRMPVDLMPGGESGVLSIFIGVRGGLPPEDIESLITKIVEDEMATLPHLESIVSVSRKEKAVVTLNFKAGTDTTRAALEVQERMAKIKGKLPKEIEKPVVSRYDESQSPIMIFAMSSKHFTPEEMREIADNQLKPLLKRVDGVANVEIGGGREKKILVEFDLSRLEAYALPIRQVISQIGSENLNVLTGKVEKDRDSYFLRTVGAYKTLDEMRELPIAVTKEGSRIRLKDVAEVRDFYMEAESYSRMNREPVVSAYVQKEALTNTISLARRLRTAGEEFKKIVDPRISFSIVNDQSVAIQNALANLRSSLLQGAFLVGIILLLFLRDLITTSYIFVTIPLSLMMTLGIMYFFKLSLDGMTILGLILASGQISDNSITVLESIYSYKLKLVQFVNRWNPRIHRLPSQIPQGYRELVKIDANGELNVNQSLANRTFSITATQRMFLVMGASTLTAVIVFLPIVFSSQHFKIMYSGLSITVTAALFCSLIVAVSVIPCLSANVPTHWTKQSSFFSSYFWLYLRRAWNRSIPVTNRVVYRGQRIVAKLNRYPFFRNHAKNIFKYYSVFIVVDLISIHFFPAVLYAKLPVKIFQLFLLINYFVSLIVVSLMTDEDVVYASNVRRDYLLVSGGYQTYRRVVGWFIRRKYQTALILFALLIGCKYLYKALDKEFLGSAEENEFIIFVELPSGTKLDVSDKIVGEVEKMLSQLPEIEKSVKNSVARVEGWSSKIYVTLLPSTERTRTTQQVMAFLRPLVSRIGQEYDAFIYFSEPVSSKEFVIDVFGFDYVQLRDVAVKIAQSLEQVSGLADIKLRYKPGRPEVRIEVDRVKASLFDFTIHDIAESLHAEIRGLRATYFITPTSQVETVARLQEQYRRTLEDIQNLSLINPKGTIVPVRQFALFEFGLTPSEVWRKDRERMIQVSANRGDLSLSKVAARGMAALRNVQVPPGYYYEIGGDFPRMLETERESTFAFLITVILIYTVLAGLFESYTQPLIILTAVPLTVIGVIPLLFITDTPVTAGTYLGFIMLGGISVNNSTILIDVFNEIRGEKNKLRALLESGQERMRPILATTLTNVLGMMPLVFQGKDAGSFWAPMAMTVIGGMTASTILILFMFPAFYLIIDDIKVWCSERFFLVMQILQRQKSYPSTSLGTRNK